MISLFILIHYIESRRRLLRELHKFDINKCNRRYCNGDFVNEKQHNIQWVEVLSKEALQD
ncbi:hypothetical protein [Bacteroides ovatus]|uniref:hypothetical protein n=1 Tax=Bacteroides ovatus TaxID=28116 RepID=UPI0009B7F877|nr:hypothetical protein [Bacteroides ovatus]